MTEEEGLVTNLQEPNVFISVTMNKNTFYSGEPIPIKLMMRNGSDRTIEILDETTVLDYYTVLFDAGNGELAEACLGSSHEALLTVDKKEENPSIACQPLIEVKKSDRSEITIGLHMPRFVNELTRVLPGECFERSIDLAKTITGTGEISIIARLNQPTNNMWSATFPILIPGMERKETFTPINPGPRIRNPVLRLSSRPITIKVLQK